MTKRKKMFIVRFLEGRSNKVQSYKNEELIPLESPVDERTTLLESLLIGHDLEKIDQLSSLLVKEKTIQCSLLFQLWNGMVTKENILTDDGKIQKKSNIDLSVTLSESWIHGDSHESTTRSQWDIFRYIEGDTVFSICDLITPWQNNEYILEKIFYELKYLQNEKCKIFANFSQTNSDSLNNIMPLPVEIEDLNVQEWCNLLDKLNQISTSVANVSIPDYSKSICDLNKKQDELTFQFFYLSKFEKCFALLQDIQQCLQTPNIKECIKSFNELYEYLHEECVENHCCLFFGETKLYLITKIEFLLKQIFALVVENFQAQLEKCDFGTLRFNLLCEALSESRIQEMCDHMSWLNFCQDVYELLMRLKKEEQSYPNDSWLAFALASLPIVNFDILFLHPSSSLSTLKFVEESFQFMTQILLAHTQFLQKCFQRFMEKNTGTSIVSTFVHLLSEHLQRFTLSQLKNIKEIQINRKGQLSNIFIQEYFRSVVDQVIKFIHILLPYGIESVKNFLLPPQQFKKDNLNFLFSLPVYEAYKNFILGQESEGSIKKHQKELTMQEELELFGLLPSNFFFHRFDALSAISGQKSFDESLFGCIIVYHQFDLSLLWNSLEDVHLMQTCYLTFSNNCSAYTGSVDEDKVTSAETHHIQFSQKVRLVLEICLTLCHKIQIIMKVPSCADVYTSLNHKVNNAEMVFRPLVEKVWNLLRSAWNEIESFLLDLKKCCFILETFQIILNCIEDCVSFPPCIYLNNELKEWKRILYRAYNIFAESILEATGLPNLQDTLKCLEYCQGTDQVVELNDLSWFPSYMKEITKYLKFEPGRSHFLNIIAEAFCKKTVEMVLCPSPLLYLNSRKCLAYFCQKVMETFILKCESQQYFQKIQDIITLLEVSNNEARQFIQEIEQENKKKEVNHSEVSDNDNDVPTMRPFLGVQLVMKAEKLIKESTRQMLSTTKFNNPHASNSSTLLCSTASSQISQFFFINKIKTLSDDECYIVLKRRREFAFSMSIGFSSN